MKYSSYSLATLMLSVAAVVSGCSPVNSTANSASQAANSSAVRTRNHSTESTAKLPNVRMTYIANLHMANDKRGIMDGFSGNKFVIAMTTDGGATWTKVPVPANSPARSEEISLAPQVTEVGKQGIVIAWAVSGKAGNKVISDTSIDGGQTWRKHIVPTGKYRPAVEGLTSYGDSNVWMLTSSGTAAGKIQHTLFSSNDKGDTWTHVSVDNGYVPSSFAPTKDAIPEWATNVKFAWQNTSTGWAVMNNDTGTGPKGNIPLRKTTDGGKTWKSVSITYPQGYVFDKSYLSFGMPVFQGMTGILPVVTENYHPALTVYQTTNGGKTWSVLEQTATQGKVEAAFASPDDGMMINQSTGELKTTSNGGRTWSVVHASGLFGISPESGVGVVHLQMLNRQTAVCAVTKFSGQTSFNETSTLYRTTDGGKHWEEVNLNG